MKMLIDEVSHLLSSKHDVSGPLQAVDDGFTTGVQVVVLVLDDRVIHVHGGNQEFTTLRQLVQAVNACNWFLNDTLNREIK
jgi:hypothetical protein